MQIYRFLDDAKPERIESADTLPEQGFLWIDFVREESPDWPERVLALTGVPIFDAHVADSLNPAHPSFFDGTEDYEMVIFRGLAPETEQERFPTHPAAFFLFPRLLVTVRPAASRSVEAVAKRLAERSIRIPRRPAGLMHHLLNAKVDRFLALREPLIEQIEQWQHSLLDPRDPFDDWLELMHQKNELRKLERLCEEQIDAVTDWREGTSADMDEHLSVRINDLLEHVRRVLTNSQHLQAEIESLVQIHFSAVAHRTNEVMRVLTVISAIFLPLTLVAGIFGMNFDYMPETKLRYSYFVTLGLMVTIGVGMLFLFRRRKWI